MGFTMDDVLGLGGVYDEEGPMFEELAAAHLGLRIIMFALLTTLPPIVVLVVGAKMFAPLLQPDLAPFPGLVDEHLQMADSGRARSWGYPSLAAPYL